MSLENMSVEECKPFNPFRLEPSQLYEILQGGNKILKFWDIT